MSQLRERFIRDLSIHNYSKRTIENYVGSIARLGKFYNQCPSEISSDQIKDYLNYCFKRGQSWSSVNIIMSARNRLYIDTLNQSEKVQSLKRPRTEKKLPVVLSEEEVVTFLSVISNIKHRAIMMTIYSAGLRCGEACNLKVRDIDSKRNRIIIRDAKGHKDREVILSQKLLSYLRHYVKIYRPKEYQFYGQDINNHISSSTLQKVFKNVMARCGILKETNCIH